MTLDTRVKEYVIEMLDGDPLSAIGFLADYRSKRAGAWAKVVSFSVLSHLTFGSMGFIDIPWGSSSAFGIPHYRFLRSKLVDKSKVADDFLEAYNLSRTTIK